MYLNFKLGLNVDYYVYFVMASLNYVLPRSNKDIYNMLVNIYIIYICLQFTSGVQK